MTGLRRNPNMSKHGDRTRVKGVGKEKQTPLASMHKVAKEKVEEMEVGYNGVVAVIGEGASEYHIRYVTYGKGKNRVDIRQYVNTEKYTGYTSKGLAIPVEDLNSLVTNLAELSKKIGEEGFNPFIVQL